MGYGICGLENLVGGGGMLWVWVLRGGLCCWFRHIEVDEREEQLLLGNTWIHHNHYPISLSQFKTYQSPSVPSTTLHNPEHVSQEIIVVSFHQSQDALASGPFGVRLVFIERKLQ